MNFEGGYHISESSRSPEAAEDQQFGKCPLRLWHHNPGLHHLQMRRMTSNSPLASPTSDQRRTSQHLRTADPRVGSRSPNSIPSSPTSIHSSSSAIFERDIEPLIPPSPPALLSQHTHHHHPPNPHRIPRAKGTEALEHSVPSVLDSAAAILSTLESDADVAEQVAVVAPVASPLESVRLGGRSSGFASPIGSFRSRSPSPVGSRTGGGRGPEQLLLNIPASGSQQPQGLSSAMSSPPVSVLGLQGMTSGVGSPSTGSGPSSTSASSPSTKPLVIPAVDAPAQPLIINQLAAGFVAPDEPSVTSTTTPSIVRSSTEDGDVTITSTSEEGSEPPTTTQEHPPALPSPQRSPRRSPASIPPALPLPPSSFASPHSLSSTTSPVSSPSSAQATLSSHPPSPVHVAKKRLSFMSYSD
ncbi:hypothetical protein CVT26_015504 [Gymnopilus dilepis]|uniref:Uncharacterized protein n=1 Tax=Gymnopilus dilepis TaxID=231916 RepID=A0A409WA23_9AGAR|nr:hypothetical protein CVT26_015504 [Gymnopilus dilepis]